MDELTTRQREVLASIQAHAEAHRMPPTLRELAEVLGISSTNGMADHLAALKRKGVVTWMPGKSRTLVVTDAGMELLAV